MSKKVKCSSCGTDNELTAVFCRSCGAKMDLAAVQADHFDHSHALTKAAIIRLIWLSVVVLLLASIGLIMWPASASGTRGNNADAKDARMKLQRLRDATKQGIEMTTEISEDEINAYLAATLYQSKKRGKEVMAGKNTVEALNVDLRPGRAQVVMKVKLYGRVPVTYKVEGIPATGAGSFQFTPKGASVGHLPMMGPAAALPIQQLSTVMKGLNAERKVLNRLSSLEMTDDSVTLKTPSG